MLPMVPLACASTPDSPLVSCPEIAHATISDVPRICPTIGIIGISSIEPDGTLRDFAPREALVRMGHISHIDKLFTDTRPPESLAKIMKTSGVEAIIAASSA